MGASGPRHVCPGLIGTLSSHGYSMGITAGPYIAGNGVLMRLNNDEAAL